MIFLTASWSKGQARQRGALRRGRAGLAKLYDTAFTTDNPL